MSAQAAELSFRELLAEVADLTACAFEDREQERPLPANLGPRALAADFAGEIPQTGRPVRQVIEIIREHIIPTSLNLASPLTFGLMTPHPLPFPAALDAFISALNQNLGCAWRTAPSAIEVELQTIRWLCELFGLPPGSGGHFTNGGTVSNLTAVRLALHHRFPDARTCGLVGMKIQPVLYVSDQAHFSIDRAAGILGLGEQHIRKIPSRSDLTMDPDRLATQIATDRDAEFLPFLVIGTAATTANGTIDPLDDLANLCRQENMWFHVDAAYGGALMLSERLKSHLNGIEKADSVTFDPHKWMFVPFALGTVLTPHQDLLRSVFSHETAYLGRDHMSEEDLAPSGFYEVSLDASRRFSGLKLWAALHHLGVSGFAEIVERQVDLAQYFYDQLRNISHIELAPRSPTNIVCFRFLPAGSDERLNGCQTEFQRRLEETVGCWLSNTTIERKRFLRVNLLNYNLRMEHIDTLLFGIEEICNSSRLGNSSGTPD